MNEKMNEKKRKGRGSSWKEGSKGCMRMRYIHVLQSGEVR